MQLFLIATIRDNAVGPILMYRILDTDTNTIKDLTIDKLIIALKNYNEEFKNIRQNHEEHAKSFIKSNIDIDSFPVIDENGKLYSKNDTTALYKVAGYDKYAIANYKGEVRELYKRTIFRMRMTDMLHICNLSIGDSYTWTEVVEEKAIDKVAFRENIDEQYKQFISKTSLMGLDNRFEYSITDYDVTLTRYIGESEKVILPNFITIIGGYAFQPSMKFGNMALTVVKNRNKNNESTNGISSIKLNEGLRVIENGAFMGNRLSELVVPSTVEIICQNAVYGNDRLKGIKVQYAYAERVLDTKNIKILSEDTLIEKQF